MTKSQLLEAISGVIERAHNGDLDPDLSVSVVWGLLHDPANLAALGVSEDCWVGEAHRVTVGYSRPEVSIPWATHGIYTVSAVHYPARVHVSGDTVEIAGPACFRTGTVAAQSPSRVSAWDASPAGLKHWNTWAT